MSRRRYSPAPTRPSPEPVAESRPAFTPQAYILAVITLLLGVAIGYIVRGSDNSAVQSAAAATVPAGSASVPATGTPGLPSNNQAFTQEMLAQSAAPLQQALARNPGDISVLLQLGNLYYDGGAYPKAIDYYQQYLGIDPKNADVITDMGTAYFYNGDPDRALKEFDRSLALRPNHPGTMFNVGVVKWQGKGDAPGAISEWQKLLRLNPNYSERAKVEEYIGKAKAHPKV